MKLLITGGSGLVGHAFKCVEHDFRNHHEVVYISSKDCDLTDLESTINTVKYHQPDCVIHLAACVGGLYKNMNQKVEMFEHNININTNIVKACHINNIDKFVGMLSTCIFPDNTTYPINEDMLHDGAPHESNDAYAYAKRMLDVQCRAYNEQHDTNYSCIIPTNIYGKNDNYNLQDAHVLPALIHKCYIAQQENKMFVVRGTGKPLRQFIHAEDLARCIMRLLPGLNKENIIISPTQEHSIGDVAKYVARAFNYEHALTYDDSYSDGQFKKTADNTKLLSRLEDVSFENIESGIKSVVKHFQSRYPNLRV